MNLPNRLTIIRIALVPIIIALFFLDSFIKYSRLWASLVFCIAALTDFADGYIARKYSLITTLGKFLDSIADKILVSSSLILLIIDSPSYTFTVITAVSVIIILSRDLIINAIRMLAASKNIIMAADMSGKIKTAVQTVVIPILMASQGFGNLFDFNYLYIYIPGLCLLLFSVLLTIISGIHYFVNVKDSLKD